jgi:hypothetical protein
MRQLTRQVTEAIQDLAARSVSDGSVPDLDISYGKYDSRGVPHLLSGNVVATTTVDIRESVFKRPNQDYLGYAADGYFYAFGRPYPELEWFEASWVTEEASPTRGTRRAFPDVAHVVVTTIEVAIFDAATGDLWMRFLSRQGDFLGSAIGGPAEFQVTAVTFIDGWLILGTGNLGLTLIDFSSDGAYWAFEDEFARLDGKLSLRNSPEFRSSGRTITGTHRRLFLNACTGLCSGHTFLPEQGKYTPFVVARHPGGVTLIYLRYAGSTDPRMYRWPFAGKVGDLLAESASQPGDPVRSDPPVDYVAAGVQPGMYMISPGVTDKITSVSPEEFTLAGTWAKRNRGHAIYVGWDLSSAYISTTHLYLTFGTSTIARMSLTSAEMEADHGSLTDVGAHIDAMTNPPPGVDLARLPSPVQAVRGLVALGDVAYAATDAGVVLFRGDAAEVLYAATGGRYLLLPSNDCRAVVIDPDTRRLVVLVRDDADYLVEVDLQSNEVIRTTRVEGPILTLSAFRSV